MDLDRADQMTPMPILRTIDGLKTIPACRARFIQQKLPYLIRFHKAVNADECLPEGHMDTTRRQ